MSNYAATVVKIEKLRPHTNADRLQIADIFGNNVIVGLDTKVGDVGLFFPLESQLGSEFAKANDLIRRKDENGKAAGGMFDENRRVRAQTLRGEKSMGFFCPLSYLDKLQAGLSETIAVGDELETVGGFDLSKKYVVFVQRRQQPTGKTNGPKVKKKRDYMIENQFRFHFDTSHYGKNKHKVTPDSIISLSWKLHGTSGILSNVLVKRDLTLIEKVAKFFGAKVQEAEYSEIVASRKVIKQIETVETKQNHGHFYKEDVWGTVAKNFKGKLKQGETLYYEIVGFLPETGGFIQKGYDYGCKDREYKVFLYRVTMTAPDGTCIDMPWSYVKNRASELFIAVTPEIYYGRAGDLLEQGTAYVMAGESFHDVLYDQISKNYVYDQDCQYCVNKVPAEGVVIRIEYPNGTIENLKHKSFAFAARETKMLDKGEEDVENSQSQDTGE